MKRILGLDIGTNSVGWALINSDFDKKEGSIIDIGSRIIPMSQDILGKFDSGQSISHTAERTSYRSVRRLYQRDNLRRERLHRVLRILGFLPEHYQNEIDFEKKLGQFLKGKEPKINYRKDGNCKYEFIFHNSFLEMANEFKKTGLNSKIPYDRTIYYLRKKALKQKITKEELAWVILNFNQKRGYYQLRGEEEELNDGKERSFETLIGHRVEDTGETLKKSGEKLFDLYFENGWKYDKPVAKPELWLGKAKEFIVTKSETKSGETKRTYKTVDSEKDWIAIKKKTEQNIDNYIGGEDNYTVGSYIYDALLNNPDQKIRGKLIKTIERKYYKRELEQILETQIRLSPELFTNELFEECIKELYPKNTAHRNSIKNKGFKHLFVNDIIFYQRPLKSKKNTIAGCQFEYRKFKVKNDETGVTEIKKEYLKVIPKSHPLFQEFRLWQLLSNLRIYKKEDNSTGKLLLNVNVTNAFLKNDIIRIHLFNFLNERKEITQKTIFDFFVKEKIIDKNDLSNYRWNYVEDKKYPANETRAQLISRLKKIDGYDLIESKYLEYETQLWHIIYSVKDKHEFKRALSTFAEKNTINIDGFVSVFENFPPFKNDYGAYSEKAIKKLLPLMRTGSRWSENNIDENTKTRIHKIIDGEYDESIKTRVRELVEKNETKLEHISDFKGLPLWLSSYIVYDRHSEAGDIVKWEAPDDIDNYLHNFKQHSLRNPIVEQVVTETLRTVSDIWKKHGFFSEIHIELGREIKNPAEKRKQLTKRNTENENTNTRIKALLNELLNSGVNVKPYSPSHQEILKLYEEGVYMNPDTEYNKINENYIEIIRKSSKPRSNDIKRYKLWLEQGYISPYTGAVIPLSELFTEKYQIEHIIPQSRYFDDSLSNKVICESQVNEFKSNQTAFEFIKNNEGSIVDLTHGKTVKLFNLSTYENHCKRYFSNNRSKLSKLLSEEIPEGFIERQLNDSRYISKLIKGLLSNIVREKDELESTSKHLVSVTGTITSKLKHDWGLNDKWNEIILPRFYRLNKLTNTNDFTSTNTKGIIIPNVPDYAGKVEKKRIDHRHHALDALVIACTSKDHVNYITSLNTARNNYSLVSKLRFIKTVHIKDAITGQTKLKDVPSDFKKPWDNFTTDAKENIEKIIVSFKQNLRVINRTNNKTWQWVKNKNGKYEKQLVLQKGKNFAIRKPMHKETVSGKLNINVPMGKIATAVRTPLTDIKNQKHIDKITDKQIREVILPNHLNNYKNEKGVVNFEAAFSIDGIENLNTNIQTLNNGKQHKPIYKVPMYEIGSKFPISESPDSSKNKKYVEAAKGTNLFFAVYWNEEKQKRVYETVPLNEVIEHQKQQVGLSKEARTPIPIKHEMGKFLFILSPNDLVYVPTDEEIKNPSLVDIENLSEEQIKRLYNVNDFSETCYFTPNTFARSIIAKEVDMDYNEKTNKTTGSFDNKTTRHNGKQIKDVCWKLTQDRLGKIINKLY